MMKAKILTYLRFTYLPPTRRLWVVAHLPDALQQKVLELLSFRKSHKGCLRCQDFVVVDARLDDSFYVDQLVCLFQYCGDVGDFPGFWKIYACPCVIVQAFFPMVPRLDSISLCIWSGPGDLFFFSRRMAFSSSEW